jgi:two-component system phosphate regulon sensor histidine kinase PhoR
MTDPGPKPPSRWPPPWRALALAAGGVGAPAVLALTGQAKTGPALIGAGLVAALAGGLWLLRVRERAEPPPAHAPPAPPAEPAFMPPFAVMLDLLADPILLIQGGPREDVSARRFVFANAAARRLLRIQRLEGPLATAIRAPEVLDAVDEALYRGETGEAVYEMRGVQDRFWRAQALPVGGQESAGGLGARLALLALRDETEIRRSERTRADFLANASHELRTPLASLTGFIETLRGHARDDPEARDRFLGIMHIQAERMRRLIDDLMSLSRIELGEHIPPAGSVDMTVAVIDVLDALAPLARERGVCFQQTLPPAGSALATADRHQVLQVIQNLAENAVKYTPPGGQVLIELLGDLTPARAAAPVSNLAAHFSILTPDHAAGQRYVAVRVRDFGPGIARMHLPRLTERFYRVEGQKMRERPGTGLGLAIVKHIVNRHRGGLIVESTPGAGALFTAYIPMAAAPAAPREPAALGDRPPA